MYDLKTILEMAGLVVQMIKIDKKTIGIAINTLRTINKYSLQQFANMVGVSEETILKWEKGIEIPTKKQIKIIKRIPNNFKGELKNASNNR